MADLTAKSNELSDELKNNATADATTKTALEKEISDLNALIAALQASDASLDGKITALQTYVGSELTSTEDWATATFATLEQYSLLQTELAAIKALVGDVSGNGNTIVEELTQSINDAVAASEQSMKAWVNEQLASGYYDIATIDAKLSALKGELADSDSKLAKDIEAQRAALEQAKSYLTEAYKEAITDAIETNNGVINTAIAESVQDVKDKVDVRLALIDNTIASIQNEINTINSRIATIEQQIVGIVSSLSDFSAVDSALQKTVADLTSKSNELNEALKNNATADAATKAALEKEISDLSELITSLQASDTLLDSKITALQSYVSGELSATEDWATATFATLEQYASLQTELAAVKALVGNGSGNTSVDELTQAINGAIVASEQSMKLWVNEQLATGYYDVATIDAKLSVLSGELTSADSELSKDIEAQRAALEQAKSELTAAYKSAISDAIETNNGVINATIASSIQAAIDKVDTKLAVIDNALAAIQKEIENIKNSIADIQQQINSINVSLADLTAVDAALQKTIDALTAKNNELNEELKNNATADAATNTALEKEISDLNTLIASLQASGASLDGKITALQSYVSSELSATEDWATATFSTLEQYASLQTELAAIKALVGNGSDNGSGSATVDELTQAINGAIVASEQSMKLWVNEQLASGYYDIATIDAKLSALSGELTSADSELSKDIEAQRAALEQAKSELTAAYKEAISDAIETNNGVINSAIASAVQTAIDKVETKLAVIDNALAAIQQEIENIKNSIAGIQQQITGINSSLADLTAVDAALQKTVADLTAKSNELSEELKNNATADAATKTALEKEISDLNALIATLQASNASLDGKITALQTYVGSELSATEDWATATFATLEQYASLQTELAAIKAIVGNGSGNTNIDELTQAINGAIAASEQSMKAWVNEQLAAGYYDIATIDAKLSALAGELTSADSELSKDIAAQRAALEQAKSELTASYKSAISDAIETNNGVINATIASTIQTAINNVDSKLAVINNALADIQKEIDNIKNSIAGIQQQITSINGSLDALTDVDAALQHSIAALTAMNAELQSRLSELAAYNVATKDHLEAEIAYLEAEIAYLEASIADLQASDASLDGKIMALQTYVSNELSATEDWATATFATLEQYASLQTELAAIKALVGNGSGNATIDEVTQAIKDAIAASEQSMKLWVNEQLATGYYDVATIDAKLSALKGELTSSDSELSKDIEAQRAALEQAKSELTAAYKSAISDAIETNNGLLNSTIATAVQTAINNVDSKLTVVNNALADIQTQINNIANRIQSVTYIPQYTDGKIKMDNATKTTELYLRISPAALATSIKKSMVKAFARYTDDPRTRALNEEFNVNVTQVSGNASSGVLHICLAEDTSNNFSESFWSGKVEAIIYIQISDGNNDIVSPAVPVVGYSIEPDGNVVTVNGVSFKMIEVKGGTFNMGSTSGASDEQPVHSVTLSDFSIGETEVTQELWEAVMGTTPSNIKGNKKPVESVSWDDCQTFITKLNQLTGGKFRLPTEAEWEFAARGGVESKGYIYSGSNVLGDVAWYAENSGFTTHDVATKAANELGIYDMSGNVYEWCQDWYSSIYYSSSPVNNPTGPSMGSYRVFRGGAWDYAAASCRSSCRSSNSPSYRLNFIGLRLAYGDLAGPNNPDIIDYSTQPFTITNTGTAVLTIKHNDNTFNIYPNEFVRIKQVADKAGAIEQVTNVPFTVSGNIMSLIYGDDFVGKTDLSGKISAFVSLFRNCTKLTDASNLVLPATTLAEYCYHGMFYGCVSLTEAPALPATKLASVCYCFMFYNCSSLTDAPALPATTLADQCYAAMFEGCSSLTDAPALPATTLASSCYLQMFSSCSSLTEAPDLPATTLAAHCYEAMFAGCSSLTEAPALPATTLAGLCYDSMFNGCISLTEAPALPATTLAIFCYFSMFDGCSSLTEAPALPATTLEWSCYFSMFNGCSSLTEAPALPATRLAQSCYKSMFYGCEKLNYIKMLATDISATDCLSDWTDGVSKTGTFVKATGAVIPSGTSGIPSGWTVSEN